MGLITTSWINPFNAVAYPNSGSGASFSNPLNVGSEDGNTANGGGYNVGYVGVAMYGGWFDDIPTDATFVSIEARIKYRVIQSGDGGAINFKMFDHFPLSDSDAVSSTSYISGSNLHNTGSLAFETFMTTNQNALDALAGGNLALGFNFTSGYGSNGYVDVVQLRVTYYTGDPSIYYFDGHGGITDSASAWFNDSSAFDGNFTQGFSGSTYAVRNNDTPSDPLPYANLLTGVGTTAPTQNTFISEVMVRMLSGYDAAGMQSWGVVRDSSGALRANPSTLTGASTYGPWITVSAPSGGWTWKEVQDLSISFYGTATGDLYSSRVSGAQVGVFFDPSVGVETFHFDGHNSAVGDSWNNIPNIIDGDASTYGNENGTGEYDLYINGTSAPSSGGNITKVEARSNNTSAYTPWTTLTPPDGGWTWSYVRDNLSVDAFYDSGSNTTAIVVFDWDDFDPAESIASSPGLILSIIEIKVTYDIPEQSGNAGAFFAFF